MSTLTETPSRDFQPLEFADRYYIQTAKDAIESLSHVAEEVRPTRTRPSPGGPAATGGGQGSARFRL